MAMVGAAKRSLQPVCYSFSMGNCWSARIKAEFAFRRGSSSGLNSKSANREGLVSTDFSSCVSAASIPPTPRSEVGSYFQPFSWNLRTKVSLGAAKGLAFLHGAEMKVIYRDFKTSNVLLDSNYNAKLSYSGLAKDGPTGDKSHVSTRIIGTHGYAAPKYLATDEISIEEEAERKVGWLLKIIFAGTASVVAYQFFPYMGDTLLQQSVSLLQVKDPLFKRMGASRLSRFAIDDERRMKIVDMGGGQELLNVLEAAKDDRTRKEALKALVALSRSDVAAGVLHQAGAIPIIHSTLNSFEYAEIESYKSNLLKRFQDLKLD